MSSSETEVALEFYRQHQLRLAKQRGSRKNPVYRRASRDRERRKRHPDWNPREETWIQHHERHLNEK